MLKKIKVEDAVNQPLLHDLTGVQTRDDKNKSVIYKKGYIVQQQDIDILKASGKNHIYVVENEDVNLIHEEDAAREFSKKAINYYVTAGDISEGKINFYATKKGVLKINKALVNRLNNLFEITLATKKSNILVDKDDLIASFRIIDLYMEIEVFQELLDFVNDNLFEIVRIKEVSAGLMTVGSEIIKDKSRDLSLVKLSTKLAEFGLGINKQEFVDDNIFAITAMLNQFANDYDIVFLTGGMSVDADDFTKEVILNYCDRIICSHTPYLPGSMFVLGIKASSIIVGCPANVVFADYTILDYLLPRLLTNDLPQTKEIMDLGYGCL